MIFKRDREKFLVESAGLKFHHCITDRIYTNKGPLDSWSYFGLLWDWASKQKFWPKFKHYVIGEEIEDFGPLLWPVGEKFVDPEMFAQGLFIFMNMDEARDDRS